MANPYRIKDNANKGIYKGEEVTVIERNHVYNYAKIKTKSSGIAIYIPLSELKRSKL